MIVTTGLFAHMVLQRTRANVCDQLFSGTCAARGDVLVRVTKGGKAAPGFARACVGRAARGKFTARLRGLTCGGPYRIELSICDPTSAAVREACRVDNVLVGDVWILAGQSNMEGIGNLRDAARPRNDVRAFYMDHRWAVAKDPLHELCTAKARVHAALGAGSRSPLKGTGPGVAFGQSMARRRRVPQGLIACAHGGTSMSQWDPAFKARRDESLYGALLERLRLNGGRAAGVVWYQGCSDAGPEASPLYTARMICLVRSLRKDLRDPRLPFAMVQIARVCTPDASISDWNSIREQQRRLPGRIAHLTVVPAIDLALDDLIHISGKDQQWLGERLAEALDVLIRGRAAGTPPIAVRDMTLAQDAVNNTVNVVVRFANVVGKLVAVGRPAGFALSNGARDMTQVFDTQLDGARVIVRTALASRVDIQDRQLYYGYGADPYCNINDTAGRSLPAFGPLSLGLTHPVTPFVCAVEKSTLTNWPGAITAVVYPADSAALGFTPAAFTQFFCFAHEDISATAPDNRLIFFRACFDCAAPMRLRLLFGYDGPVRLFSDGQPLFTDQNGTNPITPDEAHADVHWAAGRHELLFALGTNHGKAWGICLRLLRRDLKCDAPPERLIMPVPVRVQP